MLGFDLCFYAYVFTACARLVFLAVMSVINLYPRLKGYNGPVISS